MAVIKSVLKEELKNSLRMKKEYELALKKLPKGALVSRMVKGHKYYYLAAREGKKVKYKYLGKIADAEKNKYMEAKIMRAKYKNLLSKVKKQIQFLKRSLRGKEEV
ncbi:MAG: hypothetical protein KKB81_05675 [Candidatus Margulisbacteria bacterium]|nr:hypothetical protein [Candidatus Margulisiibacteriota bacterium]MBU1021865.1 hypothetical protein [Candidatus Margulisiibacteriota bacterium]MBU1729024.1 hypothetical protein [Candidatus Margulisiibacteriota bacterium]MBU1954423.1 hypothetical protein [Candidatus Margulisiibacteriota bacterium]